MVGISLLIPGSFWKASRKLARSQMGHQKLLNPRAAMGSDTSGENSSSVLIREIRG